MINPIITNELIQSYDPCKDGIDNFNKYYLNYSDTMSNLLTLDNIPYEDKIWLASKVVDYKILQKWSVLCAESVMYIYNNKYPNDNRVSECIRITKLYLDGKETLENLRAAESAAWSAAWASAAWSAAWASAESAARTAWVAARASAESAARTAAESAARTSATSSAEKEQEEINLKILIDLLEQKGL